MRHTSDMKQESLWSIAQIRGVSIMALVGVSSFAVTLAALPVWSVQNGIDGRLAGTVTTVFLVATVLTQVGSPALLRRFSLRVLLIWGLLFLGVPAPLYNWATELSGIYAVSAGRGIGFGLLTVTGALAIQVAAPRGRQGEAIGIYGLASAIPMMFGAAVGAGLTLSDHFTWVTVIAATPLLGLVAAKSITTDGTPGSHETNVALPTALRRLLLPVLLLFVATVAGGAMVTVVPLQVTDSTTATVVLIIFGGVASYARWRVGRYTDERGHRWVPQVLVLAGAVGMAIAGWGFAADNVIILILGTVGVGTAYGALQSVTLDLSFTRLPPGQASLVSATWNIFFDAGTATGAAVFAALIVTSLGGGGTMLVGTAAFVLIGLLSLRSAIALHRRHRRVSFEQG